MGGDAGLGEAIRAAGGVTELARRIGISQPSVSNWSWPALCCDPTSTRGQPTRSTTLLLLGRRNMRCLRHSSRVHRMRRC